MSPVVPDVLPWQRLSWLRNPVLVVWCQFSESCAVSTKEINLPNGVAANLRVLESDSIK